MRLNHWWCAFLSVVSMIAGDAPDHITTGKAYLEDYTANALLTAEEHRTIALLQKIQNKFAPLEDNEDDEFVGKISTYKDRFADTPSRIDTIPGMRGLNVPMLRANPVSQEHVEEKHNYVPGATVETTAADLQAKVSNDLASNYRPARGPGSTNVRVSMDATKPKKNIDDLYNLMNQLVNLERILTTQAFIKQPEQLLSKFYPPYSALSLLHAHYPYPKPLPAQRSKISKQEKMQGYKTPVHQKPVRRTTSPYQHPLFSATPSPLVYDDEAFNVNFDKKNHQAPQQWHSSSFSQAELASSKATSSENGGNSKTEAEFFIILCEGIKEGVRHDVGRQVKQAKVLLKSAVLFSKQNLHFHVIANSMNLFERLVNQTTGWPDSFRKKIRFTMHDVWYPEGKEDMQLKFRACATERLFMPEMFPNMDKAVYLDTDVIFMRPPEDLWSFFEDFSSSHIAAMASDGGGRYIQEKNKVPYYGEGGLNSGVMLMHLNRMRDIPGGWVGITLAIHEEYKDRSNGGDQDVLNVLFSSYPEKLYELPCEWNYGINHCIKGVNRCQGAQQNGVSILHGFSMAFIKGHEMKFRTIFEAFDEFQLGADSIENLYTQIAGRLWKVGQESLPGRCRSVAGIDRVLLGEMETHVRG